MSKLVSLNKIDEYDVSKIQALIEKAFVGCEIDLKPKAKVLVKVNLPDIYEVDQAQTTNPNVVAAVVNVLDKMGATCTIIDSPNKNFSNTAIDKLYFETGMLEVENMSNCKLNYDFSSSVFENLEGKKLKTITMLNAIKEADVIVNVGKLKLDNKFGLIGATANLFGFVPGKLKNVQLSRLENLADFGDLLIDIYEILQDKLVVNVLDGIVALEGNNTQRLLSLLGVSNNPFALDASVCDILNLEYDKTILKQAKNRYYFDYITKYKLTGQGVEDFKLDDFDIPEFDCKQKIFKSVRQRKHALKHNDQKVAISKKECKGCGLCAKICPVDAIENLTDKNGEFYAKINQTKCIHCNKCITACPYNIVKIKNSIGYKKIDKFLKKQNKNNLNNK